jgi:predicted amidophosphoribosyltransferase
VSGWNDRLPPFRRCPGCGRSFRAWQEAAACPSCRRAARPDREALADSVRERHDALDGHRVASPVPYNEFPPGY